MRNNKNVELGAISCVSIDTTNLKINGNKVSVVSEWEYTEGKDFASMMDAVGVNRN